MPNTSPISYEIPSSPRFKSLVGKEFNSFTVQEFAYKKGRQVFWVCICRCGVKKIRSRMTLTGGRSCCSSCNGKKSCLGDAVRGKEAPEHAIWRAIKDRCLRPKCRAFPSYGGRGIKICERWLSYIQFLEDVGRRPDKSLTLDRINNDGHYEPGNVRWATRKEQANNTRSTVFLPFNGEMLSLAEIARKLNIGRNTLTYRLKNWPLEAALTPKLTHLSSK